MPLTIGGFETGTKPWSVQLRRAVNLRRTYRHASFPVARLLGNMGVAAPTPLLARFNSPVTAALKSSGSTASSTSRRTWDDAYRFFNW